MYTKNNLATDIVDLFDKFLAKKDIKVSCSDSDEEAERQIYGNCDCLYGMEYWNLVDQVEQLLIEFD